MTLPLALAAAFTLAALGGALLLRQKEPVPLRFPWWWCAIPVTSAVAAVSISERDPVEIVLAAMAMAAPATVVGAAPLVAWWIRRSGHRSGITLPHPLPATPRQPINEIVIDKHRTITTGDMHVVDVHPIDPDHRNNLLFFAGALSLHCQRPFATALSARGRGARVSSFAEAETGRFSGAVDRHPVRLGPPEWIGLSVAEERGVILGVEVDLRALGTLRLDDTLRPNAAQEVSALAAFGPVTLVSDDSVRNTAALATDVGLQDYVAEAGATARLKQVTPGAANAGQVLMIAPRGPLNEDALAAADRAITNATEEPPPAGVTTLEPFDLAHALRALRLLQSSSSRMRRGQAIGLGFSAAGAAIAVFGVLTGWVLPLAAALTTSCAAALCLTGGRNTDEKLSPARQVPQLSARSTRSAV